MEEKNRINKWLYSTSGKLLRGFLCMLTFCLGMAGTVFSVLGIGMYGTDILQLDQNDYFESSAYQEDMLSEAEKVLGFINFVYIENAGFDDNFSITDVAKDVIYTYDMKAIIRDYVANEFMVTRISDLNKYLVSVREADMEGFLDYNKVIQYLDSERAENNYIYFNEKAFKNLFRTSGEMNVNHRFSDKFSEKAFFVFEGIGYNIDSPEEDDNNISDAATTEIWTDNNVSESVTTEVENDDFSITDNINYAVYDPVDNLFYSPSDNYFNAMDSYIYDAEELKNQLENDTNSLLTDSTVFLWLRGYNYPIGVVWTNMISRYENAREMLRRLESMEDNGSFVYYLKNSEFQCTNVKEGKDIGDLKKLYGIQGAEGKESFAENVSDPSTLNSYSETVGRIFDYQFPADTVFYFGVDTDRIHLTPDRSTWNYRNFTLFAKTLGVVIWITVILWILLIVQAALLIKTTGRKERRSEEISLYIFDRLPTELWLLIVAAVLGMCAVGMIFGYGDMIIQNNWSKVGYLVSVGIMSAFPFGFFFMILTLSFARRIKAHNLWNKLFIRNVFCKIMRGIDNFWNAKKHSEKIIILFSVYMICSVICILFIYRKNNYALGLFVLIQAVAVFIVDRWINDLKTIEKGIAELAKGNLDYQCEINKKRSLLKGMAEGINHIGDGLKVAVETSLKNERMRTELITNVSHDLKTPLTSIINYVNLLKTEKMPTKEAEHYLEVLEKKSQRLRHLTEDLVEAAKANTGNIELETIPLALDELMKQAIGEFEDKFRERNLTIVTNYPNEPVVIMADGRRMFRIVENILQNVYKYALEGTRVYADLSKTENQAVFTLKNISSAPLNISADELMERFKRGDSARTTEGSGLGLSIARDLTKLQEGSFEIQLDGDLFKVIIIFPEYIKPEREE